MNQSQTPSKFISAHLLFFIVILVFTGCRTGDVRFVKPSPGFEPKRVYVVSFDNAWAAVSQALDANHIAVASSDKADGRLQTDQIQGESVMIVPGSTAVFRYNYNIRIFSEDGGKERISIITKIEMLISGSGGTGSYKEVTQDNRDKAADLENWLYEQIEKFV